VDALIGLKKLEIDTMDQESPPGPITIKQKGEDKDESAKPVEVEVDNPAKPPETDPSVTIETEYIAKADPA